jgi:dipeptidyl-peptidase-4
VERVLVANDRLRRRVEALRRGRAEFIRLRADDGTPLDAWQMLPPGFDPSRRYPLLVHVYGEPAGTTVNDTWGGTQYLWHLMLTQRGYVVLSVDPRGTPQPRGRAWRKSVYGAVGVLASADLAAATRDFVARGYVDPGRVAVWGWSGGGSMTLNAMFRHPDLFHVGMSVAPVPDQRLYDTIYQERYMGLPQTNTEGYRQGSPITFADGLQGDLLIVHGTGDDNVHYQGTERLINRLVELNKPFTMMAYPNRTHGIGEGPGTTRHLFELLTRFLVEHAPPGAEG